MRVTLDDVYRRLYEHYGPRHWWPAETPFEIMVGAILTQNANWKNVEKAIAKLREDFLLDPREMHALSVDELAEEIRSSGYYRQKAARLKRLLDLLWDRYDGSLEEMFSHDLETLRETLLSINGIGPETADSILLYVGEKMTFVVDTYTNRVLKRHGWIEPEADYHQIKQHFESQLPAEVELYQEYHALLVQVGKEHCRKTARCEGCPLHEWLPPGGPIEPGG
jgi:endonuclease-3 related protein